MQGIRSRKGMTLIEVLSSLVIMGVIGTTLAAVLVHGIRGYSSGTSEEYATSLATIALQKLSSDLRDGKRAVVSNGKLVVTFPTLLTDAITGEKIYDYSSDDPDTRSYYIDEDEKNLVREINDDVTVLARGVDSASFEIPFGANGGTVVVTLHSTQRLGSEEKEFQVTGRVVLRNFR